MATEPCQGPMETLSDSFRAPKVVAPSDGTGSAAAVGHQPTLGRVLLGRPWARIDSTKLTVASAGDRLPQAELTIRKADRAGALSRPSRWTNTPKLSANCHRHPGYVSGKKYEHWVAEAHFGQTNLHIEKRPVEQTGPAEEIQSRGHHKRCRSPASPPVAGGISGM